MRHVAACALVAAFLGCSLDVAGPDRAPVAVVGPDREVSSGQTASLDGSASYDPDGDALSFAWQLLAAPPGDPPVLSGADQAECSLTAGPPGLILVGLVVTARAMQSEMAVMRLSVLAGCTENSDCDDRDDCTNDSCVDRQCVFDPIPGCEDLCPDDPLKTDPGVCGCGVPDVDTDSDGVMDCNDGCPEDPLKTEPGLCGCGTADTDSDSDGTPDCDDLCPDDPNKVEPGLCGCGQPESTDDTDGDGEPDCTDLCYLDPLKTEPGICGCGVPDDPTDSDSDGTPDCIDGCRDDPLKTEPGICGCGVPDLDTDSDGVMDCDDLCPEDPDKTEPGDCGCGHPETDSDSDGTPDCIDGCPFDALKIAEGVCGCGIPDTDTDSDGTPDCTDGCPADPGKIAEGVCGCGVPDTDSDADGTADCDDCAPRNAAVYPGATEICNAIDDDCDAEVDEDGCPCTVAHWHGHSYMLCPGGAEWTDARAACRSRGYDLATVDSAEENAALWSFIESAFGDVSAWHGYNDRDDEGVWLWTSGWSTIYTHWAGGQPDNSLWSEHCGHWWAGHGGEWNDIGCGSSLAYVCESACAGNDPDGDGYGDECDCGPLDPNRHPGATENCNGKDDDCDGMIDGLAFCPCLTVEVLGHVYSICDNDSTWEEARDACLAYHAQLVTIDSAGENSLVRGLMDLLDTGNFWIGYNDRGTEGTWVWEDGSQPGYENWDPSNDEPNGGTAENCAEVYDNGRWNDRRCDRDRPFVCERVPCPGDVFADIDGDGVCGDVDSCPVQYNPEQAGPCHDTSCKDLLDSGQASEDGIYWICPAGSTLAMRVWCDMNTDGGGWTLVATYGFDGRPDSWYPGSYPRPGATYYGWADGSVFEPAINSTARNFSVYAAPLWNDSMHEILAYVGGTTDDYLTASMPQGCNYFDPSGWCSETGSAFNIYDSAGHVLTPNGTACTTAHRRDPYAGDPFDEFGLHLLDGGDNEAGRHCYSTASQLGFQDLGRIFTSFESSDGSYWNAGVHSHWNESGAFNQPGALLIR
ncbi:MAG: hypothetical protein JXR96_30980 [Deltaproteobacteria bacterium]|nr:hypothetical protein [Deltaproteobacteria bacterium]